jgi:hypothetical protein
MASLVRINRCTYIQLALWAIQDLPYQAYREVDGVNISSLGLVCLAMCTILDKSRIYETPV